MSDQTSQMLLKTWLDRRLSEAEQSWLTSSLDQLREDPGDRTFFKLFSFVPRKIARADLNLTDDELAAANSVRQDWDPSQWSTDQAARILLLLASEDNPEKLKVCAEQLFDTADVAESVALYLGLPLYPEPSLYVARAIEGLRTNMRSVFEAIAHRNPFPREQFEEGPWNQMVLKALFIESTLSPIQGLDEKANPTLREMLVNYAHERWAAGRKVSPELWRCVGPHADEVALADLKTVIASDDADERAAGIAALEACNDPRAAEILREASLA